MNPSWWEAARPGCPPCWAGHGAARWWSTHGEPRNAPSARLQGCLTRYGMPPAEFLAVGRAEIARYGMELVRDRVVDATKGEDFAVVLASGTAVRARRLVLDAAARV